MLKVRLQGPKEDINWFYNVLKKSEKENELLLLDFSDCFANKGTSRFYRVYAELSRLK